MKFKNSFFLITFYLMVVSLVAQETTSKDAISLISTKKSFQVNDTIILEFKTRVKDSINLYCSNSYGSILVKPTILKDKIAFKIPSYVSKKRGIMSWKLIHKTQDLSGNINIVPLEQPVSLETYLGPPSIDSGGLDYTMLVVIPTDSLDNPIPDNSKVTIKHQFLKSEVKNNVFTNDLLSYKNIYSPLKSGRMIVSSESYGLNSKEFDLNIMPAIATNFKLYVQRNHDYADGNQITTFYTSVIKDKNRNIVSDGSYIEFYITNKKGDILKTAGTTINGVAHAKIIHPDFEDSWQVKAYFIGIAESNVLRIKFKQVIDDFNIILSDKNRTIKVGPLVSFFNQMIPDGLSVKLSIYQNNKLVKELFKESNNGFAEFFLNPNIFKNGIYNFTLKAAGIEKEIKNKKLW